MNFLSKLSPKRIKTILLSCLGGSLLIIAMSAILRYQKIEPLASIFYLVGWSFEMLTILTSFYLQLKKKF
jgi:urea transporter